MKSKQLSILVILALMLSVLGVLPAAAATANTCVAQATGNWNAAGTWTGCGGGVPGVNDTATIGGGFTVTVTAATGIVNGITVNSTGILVLGANALTIKKNAALTVNSGGTLDAGTGTVVESGASALTIIASGATFRTAITTGINGNILTTGANSFSTGANYTYNGGAAQVTGAGFIGAANLSINNAAGVTLSGSATVTGILALTSGDLTTGANTLTLGAASTSTGTGDVVGNTRRIHTFTADASYAYGNPFVVIAFNTGTTTPPTSVNVELVKHTPGGFALATTRAYTITLTGGAGLNATLTLHYAAADLNGNTAANLKLLRWNGSLWQLMGRTGAVDTVNGAVTLAGVTAFSPWAISAQNPTAVTLQDFSAQSNSSPLLPGLLALLVLTLGAVTIMTRARRHA